MQRSGNTILLTGGSSGIGLALAERLLQAGNQVIVTGRRAAMLEEAKRKVPGLVCEVSDSGNATDRERLVADLTKRFPTLNVLINNAGIQRHVNVQAPEPWEQTREEIAVNLEGPIHMVSLLLPHLLRQSWSAILNVTVARPARPKVRVMCG